MLNQRANSSRVLRAVFCLLVVAVPVFLVWHAGSVPAESPIDSSVPNVQRKPKYQPRMPFDIAGFNIVSHRHPSWPTDASLERIASVWRGIGHRLCAEVDTELAPGTMSPGVHVRLL